MGRRRLIVRRVNEGRIAMQALQRALELNQPIAVVDHGGTVANSYRWPAETECVVSVALPTGQVWTSPVRRIAANKATLAGAFAVCTGVRGPFDYRFSEKNRKKKLKEFIDTLF